MQFQTEPGSKRNTQFINVKFLWEEVSECIQLKLT